MSLHIITCSEVEFASFQAKKDRTYSSIRIQTNEEERKHYTHDFDKQFVRNAWLNFSEIEQDVTDDEDTCYYTYSKHHANIVHDMVTHCLRYGVDTLIIHCSMGICRSVSLAEAIRRTNKDVTVQNGLYVKDTGIFYPPIIERHIQFSKSKHTQTELDNHRKKVKPYENRR